jgi:2-methylisocitrate lyase-like PEP mutase family enzyme
MIDSHPAREYSQPQFAGKERSMSKRTNRREFIQAAGLAATGMLAVGQPSSALPQQQPAPTGSMGARFRELLRKRQTFENIAIYDVMSARLVEAVGFPSVYIGGNACSAFHGMPENLISMAEKVEFCTHIAKNIGIPAVADITDDSPSMIYKIVKDLERGEVAAIHFEDSGPGGIIPQAKMIDKIHAAVDARSDLVLSVRTYGLQFETKEKAIERGAAYGQAGAETVWLRTVPFEDLSRAADIVKIPLTADMEATVTMAKAREARVTVATYSSLLQAIGQGAVYNALMELKNTGVLVNSANNNKVAADVRGKITYQEQFSARRKKYRED